MELHYLSILFYGRTIHNTYSIAKYLVRHIGAHKICYHIKLHLIQFVGLETSKRNINIQSARALGILFSSFMTSLNISRRFYGRFL